MLTPIRFYHSDRPYGFLSNFYDAPILLDGVTWPTSEHYYQAQKFTDLAQQAAVRQAATPNQAAHLGRSSSALRADWTRFAMR